VPFQPGNKHGAKKSIARDLDSSPTCVRLFLGNKEALKGVEGWQDKVRAFVEGLIEEAESKKEGEQPE
jgi:hypothetical protein